MGAAGSQGSTPGDFDEQKRGLAIAVEVMTAYLQDQDGSLVQHVLQDRIDADQFVELLDGLVTLSGLLLLRLGDELGPGRGGLAELEDIARQLYGRAL